MLHLLLGEDEYSIRQALEEIKKGIGDPTVLEQLSHEFIAPQGGGQEPPLGAAGHEVWTFGTLAAGTTNVSIEYSRPWQGGEETTWTFELSVTVGE